MDKRFEKYESIKEEELKTLIKLFYEDKQQLDLYKKSTEDYNKNIKLRMSELGVDEFFSDDLSAKITHSSTETFNEAKLIEKLKEIGASNVIKTIEVVDYDELENAIYNNEIDASELTSCKIVKEITTLRVKELKKPKEC